MCFFHLSVRPSPKCLVCSYFSPVHSSHPKCFVCSHVFLTCPFENNFLDYCNGSKCSAPLRAPHGDPLQKLEFGHVIKHEIEFGSFGCIFSLFFNLVKFIFKLCWLATQRKLYIYRKQIPSEIN